ncbi:MAG: LysE family translocator [Paracoccaceae bacterium]
MDLAALLVFNLTLLAAIASPGPSLLYLVRTTLVHGRATGFAAAAGLGVMAALWTLAALLGLDVLFRLFPWAFGVMKTAGAAYLLWLAYKMWRSADDPIGEAHAPSSRSAFVGGLLINLANPKSVLFAAAVILVIFPNGLTPTDKGLIFLNHLAVELTVQPLIALAMSTAPLRVGYLKAKPVLDRIAAGVLGLLGLRLLLSRT